MMKDETQMLRVSKKAARAFKVRANREKRSMREAFDVLMGVYPHQPEKRSR